jgi:hypothetical protein
VIGLINAHLNDIPGVDIALIDRISGDEAGLADLGEIQSTLRLLQDAPVPPPQFLEDIQQTVFSTLKHEIKSAAISDTEKLATEAKIETDFEQFFRSASTDTQGPAVPRVLQRCTASPLWCATGRTRCPQDGRARDPHWPGEGRPDWLVVEYHRPGLLPLTHRKLTNT